VTSTVQQCGVEAMFTRRLFASYEKLPFLSSTS
jgi:hypothetical protein